MDRKQPVIFVKLAEIKRLLTANSGRYPRRNC